MARRDTRRETDATPATTGTTDRLVTSRETSQRLTLSRSTLWRLRDELPPVQLTPTRIAYREADIQRFIASRGTGGR
jgi:predicted DNA-binding transcriptional regulator AlpA